MPKSPQRGVQTLRLHRDLLARAAKLDGLKPAEWGRLVLERAARARIAAAERERSRLRLLERLRTGDFEEESAEEMERFDRLRHGER